MKQMLSIYYMWITLLIFGFKVTGVINWSWWYVTAFIYVPIIIGLAIILIEYITNSSIPEEDINYWRNQQVINRREQE